MMDTRLAVAKRGISGLGHELVARNMVRQTVPTFDRPTTVDQDLCAYFVGKPRGYTLRVQTDRHASRGLPADQCYVTIQAQSHAARGNLPSNEVVQLYGFDSERNIPLEVGSAPLIAAAVQGAVLSHSAELITMPIRREKAHLM